MVLDDFTPAVFRCFDRWLIQDWLAGNKDFDLPASDAATNTEHDDLDPRTWPFEHLLKLYVFADRYSTRHFRQIIFEQSQIKALKGEAIALPSAASIAYAYSNLSESTPLRQFLVRLYTSLPPPEHAKDKRAQEKTIEELPPDFVAACFMQSQRQQ